MYTTRGYGLWNDTNTGLTKILSKEMTKCSQLKWICEKMRKQYVLDRHYKVAAEEGITDKADTV
ncbi:jg4985, partial [Pararge aegeria aegeria]